MSGRTKRIVRPRRAHGSSPPRQLVDRRLRQPEQRRDLAGGCHVGPGERPTQPGFVVGMLGVHGSSRVGHERAPRVSPPIAAQRNAPERPPGPAGAPLPPPALHQRRQPREARRPSAGRSCLGCERRGPALTELDAAKARPWPPRLKNLGCGCSAALAEPWSAMTARRVVHRPQHSSQPCGWERVAPGERPRTTRSANGAPGLLARLPVPETCSDRPERARSAVHAPEAPGNAREQVQAATRNHVRRSSRVARERAVQSPASPGACGLRGAPRPLPERSRARIVRSPSPYLCQRGPTSTTRRSVIGMRHAASGVAAASWRGSRSA